MSSRVLVRVLLSVLAGAFCGLAVTCGVLVLDRPDDVVVAVPASPAAPSATATARPVRAREVLRDWDAARARAWTGADPETLAALYTRGSVAGERDTAMLRAWNRRGVRVTALSTQVLRLQVLADGRRRIVLVVTDRVARLEVARLEVARLDDARFEDVGQRLPQDRPSTRRIVLRRGPDEVWRVASVSPERPARW